MIGVFQLARRTQAPRIAQSSVEERATDRGGPGKAEMSGNGSFSLARRHAPCIPRALLATTSMAALGLALATTPSFASDWTGATSTDWFDGTNWSAGVPSSGVDAKIDTTTPNATVISTAGANAPGVFVGYSGTGTGTLTIQNGGTLSVGQSEIGNFAGAAGTVTVTGNGSSLTNTFLFVGNMGTGTLTIQNGGKVSSAVGWIGTTSSATGSVTIDGAGSSWTNSGHFYLGNDGAGTLTIQNGGTVNAGGPVRVAWDLGSAGTLNIGAASGQTAVAPGTLNASSVVFGAGTGRIVFNHTASDYIFAPAVSGAGSVTVEAGTTILTAANTYTGPTTINGGALAVEGSITSGTTVNAGGTLSGVGTVGSVVINTGGALAPGSPIGTLTINGDLTFNPGSFYRVALSPASANVSGTATLSGASVQAAVVPGSSVVKQSTILHAAGGLGATTFSGVSAPNFVASLSYTPTDVLLNLTAALGAGAGLNTNQQNVANTLNTFFNDVGTLPANFSGVFGLTGNNLGTALSQLSGEAATGAQQGAFQFMGQFFGLMLDPFIDGRGGTPGMGGALGFAPEREVLPDDVALAYAKVMKAPAYKALPAGFEQRWTAWASGFGGYNKTSGDPATGSNDLTARAAGVAAGLDYRVSRDAVIGFSLAGGGTRWDLAQGLGGGKSDTFAGGVYGAVRSGPAYVAASFGGGNHWLSTDRFAAFGDHLTARFNGESFGGRIEGGYRFGVGSGGLTPYAALQTQSFHTPTYSETDLTGGGFGLTYQGRTATDTRSELGARFDQVALVNPNAVLIVRGRLAWAHDWVSDPAVAAVFQALPGASFIVNGAAPAKDTALVSAGTELKLAKGISLLGKFDGEFAGRAQTYAGTGTIRLSW
ncbi:autotransporter outer membrane beta-barrel domain-containing protein [Bradyrhizobium iriomotense]|uniref:autotransporter outer membrane beta-barrel domain-containing protein n=1 Tax=Bradyrhizobium iriomotense TaxID=441950 RepID=UPI001B8A3D68|nr:autotransporter outer membrane beta-barrel domain-containing protein [Bradyrhizobium iriomotense]MBR0783453.1 autotransporter domain-containing protein [Bradyrhizobium iriomotense]